MIPTKEAAPPPPHPINHHVYTTAPAAEKLTLSGFEGPEKLLEIWFKPPANAPAPPIHRNNSHHLRNVRRTLEELAIRNNSRASSPAAAENSDSDSGESGIDSIIEIPGHPYAKQGKLDGHGHWKYRREGLRVVPRPVWEEMLAIVKCQVLSVVNNEFVDAYLLSESSMFVYSNRLILKTCGTTTLLNAVSRIFEIARDYCSMDDLDAIFYSRKAFLFPEKQAWPHGRWGDEVNYLDELFPSESYETGGYVVGKINGDHWCMYMATPRAQDDGEFLVDRSDSDTDSISAASTASTASPTSRRSRRRRYNSNGVPVDEEDDDYDHCDDVDSDSDDDDDCTLEIMMQDLDPELTKKFWRTSEEQAEAKAREEHEKVHGKPDLSNVINVARPNGIDGVHKNIRKAERRLLSETGICDIYPNSIVDDFLFDPCGYSLNGLLGPYYYTIHVTPEDICSYASFETSVPVRKFYNHIRPGSESEYDTFEDVVSKVVEKFKPGRFSVTLFTRRSVGAKHGHNAGLLGNTGKKGLIKGFRKCDKVVHRLGKWDMVFAHYVKSDRAGYRSGVQPLAGSMVDLKAAGSAAGAAPAPAVTPAVVSGLAAADN
ncbi:spermidine resistance protein [Chytridiales sp. JEL 0842]|nr:spermidine resistance protein [Chytridiales sp. JEL 0842]